MKISALIPAYNEEETISVIINILKQIDKIDEIIVIDDGSEDATAAIAKSSGAEVVQLTPNRGKGAAIKAGFNYLSTDIILMLDGDLIGLTPDHINKLLQPLLLDEADMVVGIFSEGRGITDLAQKLAPNLSGQRAVKFDIIKNINNLGDGFGVEISLNRYVKNKGRLKFVKLDELTHVMKEEKMGWARGVTARLKMYRDLVKTFLANYIEK